LTQNEDGKVWGSYEELRNYSGTWYLNGQEHNTLVDGDLAIVQSDAGVQTFYIYKDNDWIEYKDEDVSGSNQYT
jgi:hypothetical protein